MSKVKGCLVLPGSNPDASRSRWSNELTCWVSKSALPRVKVRKSRVKANDKSYTSRHKGSWFVRRLEGKGNDLCNGAA